jgi:hypothetical protein
MHATQVEETLRTLERENGELRQRLHEIEQREQRIGEARKQLMRGGFRLLLPLFDRQKIVRNFGKLAETLGAFTGPREQWPAREVILGDARMLMESVVRFGIRRRLFLFLFGMLGGIIPAVQVWLAMQQNKIIENQNEFAQIQVYDVVARSMTQGDRNARLMTGALLANANPEFLRGVVRESFDASLASVYRADGVNASTRRLDDAAYRGHLVRAAVRAIEKERRESSNSSAYRANRPSLQMIVGDAAGRVPEVMRLGRGSEEPNGDLVEQVDHYLVQVGSALSSYARLARANDDSAGFAQHLAPLLARLSQRPKEDGNRFAAALQTVLQDLLFDMALRPGPDDPALDVSRIGNDPGATLRAGLEQLKQVVGQSNINWVNIAQHAGVQ